MTNSSVQPPKLSLAPKPNDRPTLADEFITAFREAVGEAQATQFRAGLPIIMSRNGEIVSIDPPTNELSEAAAPLAA